MDYKKDVENLNELAAVAKTATEGFIKQLLLMSTGLLGLLISLHKTSATSDIIRIVYSTGMVSLALGIVFLSIGMYTFVDLPTKIAMDTKKRLVNKLKDNPEEMGFTVVKPGWFYVFCAKAGYVALLISVVSIAFYGVLTA